MKQKELTTCILTGFISSFVFVLFISFFYFNFFKLPLTLSIGATFVLPVFLIGGFITLFAISYVQKYYKKTTTYFCSLIVFIFSGIIFNIFALWHFIRNGWNEGVIEYLFLGVLGSVLYFHIWLLMNKITKKSENPY